MTTEFAQALEKVEKAASILFDADPSVRSVGVEKTRDGFGFVAVRNVRIVRPLASKRQFPKQVDRISVRVIDSVADPQSLVRVPHSGPGSPGVGSLIYEQQYRRPLYCGMQIQNFDDDDRTGEITKGNMTVGSIGCFVKTHFGEFALLSNNHVIAGTNRGVEGQDRILQPGGPKFTDVMWAGTLGRYVPLKPSPPGASLAAGTAMLNDIDAGLAELTRAVQYRQEYLPERNAIPPKGADTAAPNDKVHKVGRTTGLQFGTVTQVAVTVQVIYDVGECWFHNCILIEGANGTTFSDHGDSGSTIVRDRDGMVLGLLFAGNGTQTYACPIDKVLNQLGCYIP